MATDNARPWNSPVAGVLDAGVFTHDLEVEIARSRRYEHPFALLRLVVTDAAGVAPATGLQRRLSGALRLVVRWSDSVASEAPGRYLVLLRETDAPGATTAAQKLLRGIRSELAAEAEALKFQAHTAAWRKGDHRATLLARLEH